MTPDDLTPSVETFLSYAIKLEEEATLRFGQLADAMDAACNKPVGVRELVSRLAMQVHLVNEGFKDLDEKAPVEIALIVESVFISGADESQAAEAWCQELASMYRAWARNRNMNSAEIGGVPGVAAPALLVAGFGAHRTLARKSGLHVLERSESANTSGRMTARVLLATLPLGNSPRRRSVSSWRTPLTRRRARQRLCVPIGAHLRRSCAMPTVAGVVARSKRCCAETSIFLRTRRREGSADPTCHLGGSSALARG